MSVIIETSIGDITVDLYTDERPRCCRNFLKLCKIKYYNFSLFHTVQQNLVAQTGDPTATGRGGESIFARLYGEQARFFDMEVSPRIKHTKKGLISMVNNGSNMHGSQFFFTLGDGLDYLDEKHTVFGEVAEGFDVLEKLNNTFCGEDDRPYQDIRIYHTVILDDPYDDPPGLVVPAESPPPTEEMLNSDHIACDADIDEDKGKTEEELAEIMAEKEAKANTQILEMVGDLPYADVAPPENVLFVCKLNPVTTAEDLEIIFSRFGPIVSCEVIKDSKTGESLQYAFIEFEKPEHCENAYFKMDNVLVDDRRIHVDFSQSVSKLKWKGKGKGVEIKSTTDSPAYVLKNQQRQNEQYDLVYEHMDASTKMGKHAERTKKFHSNENRHQRKKRDSESPPSRSRSKHSHSPVVRSSDDHKTSRKKEDRTQKNSHYDHRFQIGETESDREMAKRKQGSDQRRRNEGYKRLKENERKGSLLNKETNKKSSLCDYQSDSDDNKAARYNDSSEDDIQREKRKKKKKKHSKHKKHKHSSE